ncbi:hypothetical protein [Acinetobacter larvae]|uniref:Uncharacterized protein n=1 Tax=Acinetobacter larvae TaxID=1789224 RepID=A0A1B2M2R4_9GAMM|nr:hypothetical protein [Acinetobacter larvae]AOA59313.1 hypothetical protein BFG52_13745 [Acinetobacter larvae]
MPQKIANAANSRANKKNQPHKTKKQNHFKLIVAAIIFIIPLLFFPAEAHSNWQYSIYKLLSEKFYLRIGQHGPLPFFTVLTSIYSVLIIFILESYIFLLFLRKQGCTKNYQQFCYDFLTSNKFGPFKTFTGLNHPLLQNSMLFAGFGIVYIGIILSFFDADISIQQSRRGALFHFAYNYRIGVIIVEMLRNLFSIMPIFLFLATMLYLFNIVRGVGYGKIKPQPNQKTKR